MSWWFRKMAVLAALPLFFVLPTVATAERIDLFESQYRLHPDGSVTVSETIVYDFEEAERRGIYRTLETDHAQPATTWLKERRVDMRIERVLRNGQAEPYRTTEGGDAAEVRIGDPDVFITGRHTYEIVYTLSGALSYGTGWAEFYWNSTGHGWSVPISHARAIVVATENMFLPERYCYVGVIGSLTTCEITVSDREDDLAIITFTATSLAPGEGLTIAQAMNPEAVAVLVNETWTVWLFALAGAVFLAVLVGTAIYRQQTHHKPNVPIIVQYEPYQDLLPMYTGVLFDQRLDPHDITAGIVYLAEQGFIKIRRMETKLLGIFSTSDYELTLLRPVAEAYNEPLRAVLEWIFGASAEKTISLSALAGEHETNRRAILGLQKIFRSALEREGYIETVSSFFNLPTGRFIMAMVFLVIVGAGGAALQGAPWPLALSAIAVVLLVASLVPRRTRKGYEARFHLLGFKQFLSVTDSERFAFHNAPEKSPELFMQYLPYAIALKVEKEWAKVFEGITIPNPGWYEGTHMGAFSAAAFASDMGAFASSVADSSGSTGSSGGGSSGGGGGGGGGGSW